MRKSQLDFLCKAFGDQTLPDNEKWKCIKYIFIENPIVDVELLIKKNEIKYIDNAENGAGFYILATPNADFGISKLNEKLVTFIPLKIIDKISLNVKSLNNENSKTIII
jgi:hypothetical protein